MTRHIYNVVLVVVGTFAILSGGQLPYTIFITLLMIRLTMRYILKENAKNLFMMSYTGDVTISAGQEIDIEYKVTNTGLLPIAHAKMAFQFSEKLDAVTPLKEIAFINSYQMINFSKKLNCLYHGFYKVGSVEIQVYDPLLLNSKTITYDKKVNITVYPQIYPLGKFGIDSHAVMGTEHSKLSDQRDRTSIQNIRPYQRGDSLKDIHWKVSAKKGDLHTKTFEQALRKKCVIIIDGFSGYRDEGFNLDDEEIMVSFAASLVTQIISREIQTSLYLNGHCIEGKSMANYDSYLEALTGFSLTDDMGIDALFRRIVSEEGQNQQYILIVPMLKNTLIDILSIFKNQGVLVRVYIEKGLRPQQAYLLGKVRDLGLDVTFLGGEVKL